MKRQSARLSENGEPIVWLGVNFWSRVGGPRMWRDYDAAVVGEELRTMRDHGMTVTRSFFYWPDFMPTPDALDEVLVERFRDFLDQHEALGMTSIPTFIVGHMSGENWDPVCVTAAASSATCGSWLGRPGTFVSSLRGSPSIRQSQHGS